MYTYSMNQMIKVLPCPPPFHIEMENEFAVQTCIIDVRVLKGK